MRRGFSLIELLIVIGIIAMVSVVALKNFSGSYGPGDRVLVKNQLVKSFAEARLKAKMSGQVVALNFDEDEKLIRIDFVEGISEQESEARPSFEDEGFSLPASSTWSVESGEPFVFYPDGEASGDEFVIECEKSIFSIQIDRLNSQLIINEE
jgi:prepilin-type N-terminal cleavage/methylation domain-containing protein